MYCTKKPNFWQSDQGLAFPRLHVYFMDRVIDKVHGAYFEAKGRVKTVMAKHLHVGASSGDVTTPPPSSSPEGPWEDLLLGGVHDTGQLVANGSYASVVELQFRGLKCAGKRLHTILYDNASPQEKERMLERFQEECQLLNRLKHPNIVQFLGVHMQGEDFPVLVMEFLHCTLSECLECYGVLQERVSLGILDDVATGLCYLHGHRPPIVHRDLSANNVLLSSDMRAKISDLGVAKILDMTPARMSQMTKCPGTPPYMPPEALEMNPNYSTKLDCFSMGVVILHVLCGKWPIPSEPSRLNLENNSLIALTEVERRKRYFEDVSSDHPLTSLVHSCLENHPPRRPDAEKILGVIREVISKASNPPPSSSSPSSPPSSSTACEQLDLARKNKELSEKLELLQKECDQWKESSREVEKLKALVRVKNTQIRNLQSKSCKSPMIILIGPSGSGKSTLGNFLLDPSEEHIMGSHQAFPTARSARPETQAISCKPSADGEFLVVDTPGSIQSHTAELEFIVSLLQTIQDTGETFCSIVCAKFDSRMDSQFLANVKYFKELLPALFQTGNVVLAMTNFTTDSRSVKQRAMQGVKVGEVVSEATEAITEAAGLSCKPQAFCIDCLPMDASEREASLKIRRDIVDHVTQCMEQPSSISRDVTDLEVAKPPYLRQQDDSLLTSLDKEVLELHGKLVEAESSREAIAEELEVTKETKNRLSYDLMRMEDELKDIDSPDLTVTEEWKVSKPWKPCVLTESFDLKAKWPVRKCVRWDNGFIDWKSYKESEFGAVGTIHGKFARGLYASVSLHSEKNVVHKERIVALKAQIAEKREALARSKTVIQELKDRRHGFGLQKGEIEARMADKNREKETLSAHSLTLQQARERLDTLQLTNGV